MKIKECDDRKLAVMLKKLPLISMQLGHVNPFSTVRDYIVSSNDSVELNFICDLFTTPTEEIIEKWYSGKSNAGLVLQKINNIQKL